MGNATRKMSVVEAVPAANGGLTDATEKLTEDAAIGTGRPGEGDAGRNVLVVPGPIGLLPVALSREIELHDGSIIMAGDHALPALIEPVMQAHRGTTLRAVCLVP